ncbi:conserved hypothetical protein [Solidesulfovibrio fructosivorans JJ]]|uniref:Uncharacterized protein n=1 Tax=Solidesulfovibrio fructosivorans JJ] TaxID=596151 RepID=E1K1P4_SOLFR|nr:hypothetical protein [Solidesulfovibrio fructosivorans]EFL49482.1 conserved hypothetical protein [Solidesulfovibrio fructosivorans JJ]]
MLQPDAKTARQAQELEAEIAVLTEQRDAMAKRIRELMDAEDVKAGVYHAQEIFAAKQEKLALDTSLDIARRRRNRLLMA